MQSAAVYMKSTGPESFSRESLIYENVEMALAHFASVERHPVAPEDKTRPHFPPGLVDIVSQDRVVAMGVLALTLAADFQKRGLLAGNLGIEDEEHSADDIAQLIWSCANTSRIVGVGEDAWRAAQMLPVADRRHYDVPPLKLPPLQVGTVAQSLFIINHAADDRQARELAELAVNAGFTVACSGLLPNARHRRLPAIHPFCCPEAAIHVHVGHHSTLSKTFRLTDSWHSGRLAVQLIPPRPFAGWDAGALLIEHEVNGFRCHSLGAVLAICEEIQQDHVLSRKLIGAGHRSAEPLARAWAAIAQDLLI